MSRRSPIDASCATRAAYERALAARLTATELRVFLAIAHEVTGYDRIEDRVANRVLAELAGVHPRHVRRAVNAVVDKGIIERDVSCRNRYSASLYRFPIPSTKDSTEGAEDAPEAKGAEPAHADETDEGAKGAELDSQGGNSRQPRAAPTRRIRSSIRSFFRGRESRADREAEAPGPTGPRPALSQSSEDEDQPRRDPRPRRDRRVGRREGVLHLALRPGEGDREEASRHRRRLPEIELGSFMQ